MRFAIPVILLVVVLISVSCSGQGELERGEFTVELNGVNIFYEVRGQGPVCMVMPNGWGVSHDALQFMFKDLEGMMTLVYFDPRGMGRSGEAETDQMLSRATVEADLDALRRHLGLEKVIVLGWSHGGSEAIEYAVDRPEAIEKLIIVHSTAYSSEEMNQRYAEKYPESVEAITQMYELQEPEEEMDRRMRRLLLETLFPAILADPDAHKHLIESMFAEADLSWRHMAYVQRGDAPVDAREGLKNVTAPILFITGRQDATDPEYLYESMTRAPSLQHVIFEHSGHFAPFEEPERFISVIRDFLAQP